MTRRVRGAHPALRLLGCILLLSGVPLWARRPLAIPGDKRLKDGPGWMDGLVLWMGGMVSGYLALHPSALQYPPLNLSSSQAPCDDFYGYVCNEWLAANEPKATHENERTTFSELEKRNFGILAQELQHPPSGLSELKVVANAHRLYSSCMDLKAIDARAAPTAAKELLRPIESWRSGNLTFSEAAGRLLTMGVSPLFSGGVRGLSQGITQNDGTFPWLLPDCKVAHKADYLNALGSFADRVLMAFRGDELDGPPSLTSNSPGRKVALLEKSLWDIRLTRDEELEAGGNDTLVMQLSSEDLSSMTGSWINAGELLGAANGNITVVHPSFFRQLAQVLAQHGNDTVADYLTVSSAKAYGVAMPADIRTAWAEYMGAVGGTDGKEYPRSPVCAKIVSALFTSVADRLFVDAAFDEATLEAGTRLAGEVKQAWAKRLSNYSWFDEDSAASAVARVQNSIVVIGFDEIVKNNTALEVDSLEAGYPHMSGDFLHNYVACRRSASATAGFAQIQSQKVFTEFVGIANAYCQMSRPGGYSVAVSAGTLQEPFFSINRPAVFNYAGLGFLVGHELSHGFDNVGSHYDALGRLRPWMSKETTAEFNRRAEKVVDLFDAIPVKLDGVSTHVRGRQTLGENLADNGGIRAAWDAFVQSAAESSTDVHTVARYGLTADQLFFAGYARSWCSHYTDTSALARTLQNAHPLSSFRVKETLANFPSFADAFDCQKGSPYAPKQTVTLWRKR